MKKIQVSIYFKLLEENKNSMVRMILYNTFSTPLKPEILKQI